MRDRGDVVGFYIRKSVSAGPFRFNLSSSGLGMSVGVRGFRLGTGPRGNYVHMGRGGLYYRASLNGKPQQQREASPPFLSQDSVTPMQLVENGDVHQMMSSSSSGVLEQINEKAASLRTWPWVLGLTILASAWMSSEPTLAASSSLTLLIGLAATGLAWYWDKQRRTVVIMYDLGEDLLRSYEAFARAVEELGTANRIWNVEAAGRTNDWKRNAGAGTLLNRAPARIGYGLPSVVRTNVSVPAIIGGKQSIYFFPDVAIVSDGSKFGAIAHRDIQLVWSNSVFLETESVPRDAQVIGHSWQYVNRNGGPDRRFNNNRQIPQVNYQEMGLTSSGSFKKILQISKNTDRSALNTAYRNLAVQVHNLLEAPGSEAINQILQTDGVAWSDTTDASVVIPPTKDNWRRPTYAIAGILVLLAVASSLNTEPSTQSENSEPIPSTSTTPTQLAANTVSPSFDCNIVQSSVLKLVCSTPTLAQADQQLASAYAQARAASADPQALRLEQRDWIKLRNNSPTDVNVIQQLYTDRIAALNNIATAQSAFNSGNQHAGDTSPAVPPTQQNTPRQFYYIVGLDANVDYSLALRSEPSDQTGTLLRQLGPHILMTVLEAQGSWSRVRTMAGDEGWVSSDYIRCCKAL